MKTLRLDIFMAEKGVARSREHAKELIKAGCVLVDGKQITKPSFGVGEECEITISGEICPYVGRGGLKLEKAIEAFSLELGGMVCVDLGASTGGFTDCMLKHGAAKVYAVDVGHGQLDKSLVGDPAVINLEGINVKNVTCELIGEKADLVTADLSFISVRNSLPAIRSLMKPDGCAVILIKPQFEVGRQNIGKGGIVKDPAVHKRMLSELLPFIDSCGLSVENVTFSPIKGGDGNIEYLALLRNKTGDGKQDSPKWDVEQSVNLVNESFSKFK